MNGKERREEMIAELQAAGGPISGGKLAERFGVSRQVVVQDIALLRAAGYEILSASRGYLLGGDQKAIRTFRVSHTDEEMEDELISIVDLGGLVRDVTVEHEVYGRLTVPLNLASRLHVRKFMDNIRSGKSQPLKNLTDNVHFHTVEAESGKVLDLIEEELKRKGYLL